MSSLYRTVTGESKPKAPDTAVQNRQRVLILTSRGVTYRHRHLMEDIAAMLPHSKKDSKMDMKVGRRVRWCTVVRTNCV